MFADDGKKVAFNQAPGLEALTFLKSLWDEGAIPKTALSNANVVADQALGKGQVAMGYHQYVPADAGTVGQDLGRGERRDRYAADRQEAGRVRPPRWHRAERRTRRTRTRRRSSCRS